MKINSTLAFAGAFVACLSGAAPAKDKPVAGSGLRLGQAVVKAAQAADAALQANDPATAEPLVVQTEAAAGSDGEKYVAAALRYRLETLKVVGKQQASATTVDRSGLAKPLDALIANPLTPQADRARYTYTRAQLAYAGRQYPVAVEYFGRARALGYAGPDQGLGSVRAKVENGDVAGGTAELDTIMATQSASGQQAPVDYYRFAIARANKAKLTPQTVGWMNKYAAAYPGAQTWYEVLATYGLQHDATATLDAAQKLDIYRLMRASGALGDQYLYANYAQTAQGAGVPTEAQAVLKEGIVKGKIPAGNVEAKAMLTVLDRTAKAQGTPAALEAKAGTAATGQAAALAGDVYLGAGNNAKAATQYRAALGKGGVDADAVNTHLGIALARSGDKAGAQAAFAAVTGSPRADIASFWTTWLNTPS